MGQGREKKEEEGESQSRTLHFPSLHVKYVHPHTVVGVYINTMTTTFGNINIYLLFPINLMSSSNIYSYNFCHSTRGVREGSMKKIIYTIYFQMSSLYCIDIDAGHRIMC